MADRVVPTKEAEVEAAEITVQAIVTTLHRRRWEVSGNLCRVVEVALKR